MAGTLTNFNPVKIRAGSVGKLWTGLAIPAGGGRITLATDGTPDATANPTALHLGLTRAGATFSMKPKFETFEGDEFNSPIKTRMTELEATISAELLQIFDLDILQNITAGYGTRSSGAGYDQITFGSNAQSYTSIALIFPTEADPTKFAVFNLYKANNEAGLDGIEISRKTMSGVKVMFRGYDIPGRAATDTLGNYWVQP